MVCCAMVCCAMVCCAMVCDAMVCCAQAAQDTWVMELLGPVAAAAPPGTAWHKAGSHTGLGGREEAHN